MEEGSAQTLAVAQLLPLLFHLLSPHKCTPCADRTLMSPWLFLQGRVLNMLCLPLSDIPVPLHFWTQISGKSAPPAMWCPRKPPYALRVARAVLQVPNWLVSDRGTMYQHGCTLRSCLFSTSLRQEGFGFSSSPVTAKRPLRY